MPEPQADRPRRLEEFRVWHERQPEVWEFFEGVPKPGRTGSMARTMIKGNVASLLGNAFLTDIAPSDLLRLEPPGIEIALAATRECPSREGTVPHG